MLTLESNSRTVSVIENGFRRILVMLAIFSLASCASPYDVVVANGTHQQEIEKHSLNIVWKDGNSNIGVLKQQRGTGLQKPAITDDERSEAIRAGRRIALALSSDLTRNISKKIDNYVARTGLQRSEMVVEMAQNVVSTQGNRDVIVIVYLHPTVTDHLQWSRSIKISLSNFESDNTIVDKFSSAIVAEMKNSGLVQ